MNFKYSGHGAFPCRYTWLPKVVRELSRLPELFGDEDEAMVRLGVGKNMVRAIRFWATAADIAKPQESRGVSWQLTPLATSVLGAGGLDEYLEDIQTLWLLHWHLATQAPDALFAWHMMLNHWHRPNFTHNEVLAFFEKQTATAEKPLSKVTLEEHINVFINTYVSRRDDKQELVEETLDCPLVELELIQEVGKRSGTGRAERIYAFRLEEKPEISADLFAYCLDSYWRRRHSEERTLTFNQIAVGEGSPGQVLKLPEHAIRDRLEVIEQETSAFIYQDSTARQIVSRKGEIPSAVLLKRIYRSR